MTRANDIASLVDSAGDIITAALDNVPTPSLNSLGIDNHDQVTVDANGNVTFDGREVVPLAKGTEIDSTGDLNNQEPNSVAYYQGGNQAANSGGTNNGLILNMSSRFLDGAHDNTTDERAAQIYIGDTNTQTGSGGVSGGMWVRPKQGNSGWHRWGRVSASNMAGNIVQVLSTNYSGFSSTTNNTGVTFADVDMYLTHPDSFVLVVAHVNAHSQDDSEASLEYLKTDTAGNVGSWTRDNKLNGNGTRKCIGDFAWSHLSNNGVHCCSTSILADFGSDCKRIQVRIRVSAENNTAGGVFINTGIGGNSTGGYNFDTAKCTLTVYEIARGGQTGGVNQ